MAEVVSKYRWRIDVIIIHITDLNREHASVGCHSPFPVLTIAEESSASEWELTTSPEVILCLRDVNVLLEKNNPFST